MENKFSDLGTKLRHLIELLDKDVESCYKDLKFNNYKPRYTKIFRALIDNESLSIGEICEITKMSQPRVSQTVKDMQKNQLVKPVKTKDARVVRICLSESAMSMIPVLTIQWQATYKAHESLDRELSHSLDDLIQQSIEALEKKSFKQRIKEHS